VELSHHLEPDDDWLVAQLAELAEAAGLPTLVTNQVHYATAGGHRLQDVLVCIRHGATLDEARELLLPNGEYRLKSADELARIGAGLPDAAARRAWADGMARAATIGQSCQLDLNFERYRFPGFTVPEGETPFSYLYQLAHDGLQRRYRPITRQSVKQLAHELEIIERTNLAEFFLIVWDLMEFARPKGIIGQVVAQGQGKRGSGRAVPRRVGGLARHSARRQIGLAPAVPSRRDRLRLHVQAGLLEEPAEATVQREVAGHIRSVARVERLGHAVDRLDREAERFGHLAHR
jgi:DNA polymerase III alpha subunit